MQANSTTLLPLLLERRFGRDWHQHWLQVDDAEMRWLAIYLADEASKGRKLDSETAALGVIAEGRAWLPARSRTARATSAVLAGLRAAHLWPLTC